MTRSFLAAVAMLAAAQSWAASEGEQLKDITLRTFEDKPTPVPSFGEKVIAIFYTDADVPDLNDPLADAIKKMDPNLTYYSGIGVANLNDSKAPNFIIRGVIKGKIEKYKSTIVTDVDNTLSKAWDLGDCNNTAVVLIIGKDKKVKFLRKGAVAGADIEKALAIIKAEIASLEPAAAAPAPTAPAPEAAPAPAASPAAATPSK